jgi:hypothetical protein
MFSPQRNVESENTANFTFHQSGAFHQNEKRFRRCCAIALAIEKAGQKSYSWAGGFKAASAKMIDEYMYNLPVIPATSIQEIKYRLQPFVSYVPDGTCLDDAHGFVEGWGKL